MATRNIITLNSITTTNTTNLWTYLAGPAAVNENTNPQFNRTVVLTPTGILLTVGGNSVGLPMGVFTAACAQANPLVTWVPNFANQPSNAFVGNGNTTAVSFITIAQDEVMTDLNYQWQYSNGVNIAASTPYANVTTNHLNISNTSGLIGQAYQVVATNPTGSTVSNQGTVYFDPTITAQPSNASVTHPAGANFAVAAFGATTLAYQWTANGSNITTAGAAGYSGYTTNTLSVSVSNGLNATNYYVIVTGSLGKTNSANALFTVL